MGTPVIRDPRRTPALGSGLYPTIGAALWIAAAVQFVVAMVVVQLAWTTPYDPLTNAVSDLGAVHCAENAMGTSYVCSPLHVVFNVSIIVLGLLIATGGLLVRPALPPGRWTVAGVGLLIVSGFGACLVGLFPEDTIGALHALGALFAFVGAGTAMLAFAVSMWYLPEWRGYRIMSLVAGVVSCGTIVASGVREQYGPIGFGGLERIVVAPALVWIVVVGSVVLRRSVAQ